MKEKINWISDNNKWVDNNHNKKIRVMNAKSNLQLEFDCFELVMEILAAAHTP